MNKEKDLKHLAEDYRQIKAPAELKLKARQILGQEYQPETESDSSHNPAQEHNPDTTQPFRQVSAQNLRRRHVPFRTAGLAAACLIAVFITGVNVSPTFAESVRRIPIIGTAAEFVTFRAYEDNTENHQIVIDLAELEGLNNQNLQNSLNQKYRDQAQILYDDFNERLKGGVQNISMLSEYSVKADNGITMSIEHSTFVAQASGAQSLEYDTIDTQNEIYITLPALFRDDSYIEIINKEIIRQMEAQMKADESKMFFIDETGFQTISANQQFYINNDHQLVITFDEYAVAPGVMGTQEFVIPTEVIKDVLVGDAYIK